MRLNTLLILLRFLGIASDILTIGSCFPKLFK